MFNFKTTCTFRTNVCSEISKLINNLKIYINGNKNRFTIYNLYIKFYVFTNINFVRCKCRSNKSDNIYWLVVISETRFKEKYLPFFFLNLCFFVRAKNMFGVASPT